MENSKVTIFYSWQTDLPNSTTRGLIESSINAAVKALKDTVTVEADRDTKGVYGSPDIVQTILSKIDTCDIFVADVSPVATYHPMNNDGKFSERLKMAPNPNVLLELGYASHVIGWENVICIMNEDYLDGAEIPFDIAHHRLTRYSLKDREKADVRRELRGIISEAVMNIMENGKKVKPQYSNIILGTWMQENKTVSQRLVPYNMLSEGPAQDEINRLSQKALQLFSEIQSLKVVCNNLPAKNDKAEILPGSFDVREGKGLQRLVLNQWKPVQISEEDQEWVTQQINKWLGREVQHGFFDFGGLERKDPIFPTEGTEFDGTDDEIEKHDKYVDLCNTIARMESLSIYRKTFEGLVLIPLAVKNESSISDKDISISIQVDTTSAEIVYPTSKLICKDLEGLEGYICEDDLLPAVFTPAETIDISIEPDSDFLDITQNIHVFSAAGINGNPRYNAEDYAQELSNYIAEPVHGSCSHFNFHINSLHAKEAKYLSRLIVLKPLKDRIEMKYSIKSNSSDGQLAGTLEMVLDTPMTT